jgi:hypothetical protein
MNNRVSLVFISALALALNSDYSKKINLYGLYPGKVNEQKPFSIKPERMTEANHL